MAGDPYFDDVRLLLHMDGSDDGTTFTDVIGKTITRSGDVVTKTATKKYGTASAYFDGNGDYLSFTPGASMSMGGSADFTFECWVNLSALPSNSLVPIILSSNSPYPDYGWAIYSSTVFYFYYTTNAGVWSSEYFIVPEMATGQWYHLALCRSGDTLRLFIDGTQQGGDKSFAVTFRAYTSADWRIGLWESYLNGFLDDLRITIGAARYTENFTPPSEAFPDEPVATYVDAILDLSYALNIAHFSGDITETSGITDWRIRVHDLSGALLHEDVSSGDTYTVAANTLEPAWISCAPLIDGAWQPSTAYNSGDYIVTTSPQATPYLYVCTTAGTSGSAEPTWGTTPSGTTSDGTAVWTCKAALVRPLIHGPIEPS